MHFTMDGTTVLYIHMLLFFDVSGMEKKSNVMGDDERRIVAYHEAGHALLGWLLEHTDPVLKVVNACHPCHDSITIDGRCVHHRFLLYHGPRGHWGFLNTSLQIRSCIPLNRFILPSIFHSSFM